MARPDGASFVSMVSRVNVRLVGARDSVQEAIEDLLGVFAEIEAGCSRFDPDSDLSRVNADPAGWHEVSPYCFLTLREAARAYEATDGLFDPRVLGTLRSLGYDRSLPFEAGELHLDSAAGAGAGSRADDSLMIDHEVWDPDFDPDRNALRVGDDPVDLGGIGKGMAVRLAAACLETVADGFLIEAGGDLVVRGDSPRPGGWRISVEDPQDPARALAMLCLTDTGCVTSSVSVRSWTLQGRHWHHLIDPRTGRSARGGLLAVTVLHEDPAWAEVWSKAMFIAGAGQVRTIAQDQHLPALWVREDGRVELTDAMRGSVEWVADGRFAG
ncbi:MAG TPA: FAD:protein FMN transferase [Kineosporiaceae bacterium]|nr:FAD:protein FMN transferase [Kineosporiaceae bacterium]